MSLSGKIAAITGGAQGIGRAAALRFAAQGASVAVLDRNEETGTETVRAIRQAGGAAEFVSVDVTDEGQVRTAMTATAQRFGGLHLLVTSAGILQGAYQAVDELDAATFRRVVEVNLVGTFLCCKEAVPYLERSGGGVILCVGSGAGVRGPSSSLAYGASKAGVHGFCMTLEPQLAARGIRVHAVCPGSIDTALKRQNVRDGAQARGENPEDTLARTRLGDPDRVADVLTLLASEEAAYLRGAIFTR